MTKSKWHSTQYPGVRFRLHDKRKHNGKPDRYFVIRIKRNRKAKEEAVGWSSEFMNAQKANSLRSEITKNIRKGKRPQSIAEMREIDLIKRKTEARQKETEQLDNITFGTVAEEYLEWLQLNKKAPKGNQSRYKNHIKPLFENKPLKEISPILLEKFKRNLQKKNLAPKTIHHCLTMIRTVYRKSISWGYFNGVIPTTNVEFPQINNERIRFFSHQEASDLLEALRERSPLTHDQTLLALHCGLRSDEIRNMRLKNVDLNQAILHLPETKSGKKQQVYITEEVKKMLLNRISSNAKPNDYVFPGRNGGKQYKISDTFKRTIDDLGFNDGLDKRDRQNRAVFHTCRHTFCSWLAIQGTPLYTIKELARHNSITQTERYAHLQPKQKQVALKEMAEAFRKAQTNEKTVPTKKEVKHG